MKGNLSILLGRPVLVAAGLIAASALIWFLGPLLQLGEFRPLAADWTRWLAITVFGVAAVACAGARSAQAARANSRLLDGLAQSGSGAAPTATVAAPGSAPAAAPGSADVALIGRRFEEALAQLKGSRLGAKRGLLGAIGGAPYVYQLPWYVIIGAPGAGKTTALAHSGLEFPLAAKFGKRGVRGIGGTRNCDWWFTTDAVLVDTAGRFTTQDSDRAADQAAWFGFLDLLKKHRPRRPLNGVLLTISVSDLLTANREEQHQHARKLRERVDELYARLGAGVPIYVLVTKLDLLAGFIEFFADFDKDERAQVWGITFPYETGAAEPDPLARLPGELVALEKRLDERLIERLQGESDRDRRAAIYAFPQQWRVLRETLADFLRATFATAGAQQHPLVRGIYFTSATQEGTPIDRALGSVARALGLASRMVAPARSSGKTFFVTRLLRDVVFAEAGLIGADLRWKKRRVRLEWGAVAAVGGVVAGALVLAWRGYVENRNYLAEVNKLSAALERSVAAAKTSAPTDLVALLPVFESVQAIGQRAAGGGTGFSAWLDLGLDQRDRFAAAGEDAYLRLLKDALLPRLAVRLQERLRAGGQERIDTIYEALKAYLMLFSGQNFDRNALRSYLRADWDLTLPATVSADASMQLRRHFDQLVASGEVGAPALADKALIDRTRQLVTRVPLAQRAYNRLKGLDVRELGLPSGAPAEFSVESAGGPAAKQVFARASGRVLSQGVPVLYTRAVFAQVRPRSEAVLTQLAAESGWVLGAAADKVDAARVLDEIEQLYRADYGKAWDEFLRDIRLVPTNDLAQTTQVAQVLARTDSPLAALIAAAAREVAFEQRGAQSGTADNASPLGERFVDLRRFAEGQPSPLQETLSVVGKLSNHLAAIDDAAKRKIAAPASDVVRELAALAPRAPEPVRAMLTQLASAGSAQMFVARRGDLSRQLAGEVGAACNRALQGRYPVARASRDDLSLEEFAQVFGAGGVIDGYFQRNLAPFVDTSTRTWTLPNAEGRAVPADVLQPFQRAQLVRDAFFGGGGKKPGVHFEFRLLELDPGVNGFEFEVDGRNLRFGRDARGPFAVTWPGAAGTQRVRLGFVASGPGAGNRFTFEGAWALFRLFERVRVEPGASPDRVNVIFDLEGRRARFEIRSATPVNPIGLAALDQFQCPQRL